MFITTAKEISEAYPTSRLTAKDAQALIASANEEEYLMLDPLLGEQLISDLAEDYRKLVETYGGITSDKVALTEGQSRTMEATAGVVLQSLDPAEIKKVKLLRSIQSAIVYRMFSNKIYSLSTSLNLGGGANRASAGDYEPADDKHIQELRKELWMNSVRQCDLILHQLEQDAKCSEPLWLEAWKESDGYYMKEDLLFPTMRSIKPYINCDQPTKFLTLSAAIRYCQDTYIAPRVDDELLERLTDVTLALTPADKKAQKLLRQALAYYVKAKEGSRDERNEALMTADSSMSTALEYIKKIEPAPDQPTDLQPLPTSPGGGDSNQSPLKGDRGSCCCCNSSDSEYSAFSTLMPDLNRW